MLALLGEIYFVCSNHLQLQQDMSEWQSNTNYLNEKLKTPGFLCFQIHWTAVYLGISYDNSY